MEGEEAARLQALREQMLAELVRWPPWQAVLLLQGFAAARAHPGSKKTPSCSGSGRCRLAGSLGIG